MTTPPFSADMFDVAKSVFQQMNIEHSAIMRRFTAAGGVANWDRAPPSVWLTAWVIRIFSHVSFQDWEDYIYIDPLVRQYPSLSHQCCNLIFLQITSSAAIWLLNYQTTSGYFVEVENGTLHQAFVPGNPGKDSSYIALTAHVLIGLEAVSKNLQVILSCT